jgi:flagellar basal-body rod modification protein FlgD
MDITGILAAADPNSAKNANDKTKFGNDYSQFLRLLTTQLKNQDPTSPMDTATFTNQLVQFSAVEQQIKSNDYLQKILSLNTLSLQGVGLGYVGLNVYSPGSSFHFNATNASDVSYSMPEGAAAGQITITDASGATVFSKEADLTMGQHTFSWDGKTNAGGVAPAGDYKINVGAQDKDKNALTTVTYTSGIVQGVETGDDGNVNVIINNKLVPVTDVRQATLQGYAPAPTAETGT